MKLHALVGTESEFDHAEKGDALYAFELALCACVPMSIGLPSLSQHMRVSQAMWDSMAISTFLNKLLELYRAGCSSLCELPRRGASHAMLCRRG